MITKTTLEYLEKLIEKGERLDDRDLKEYRDIKVEVGIGENAEGSARVKIGETEVIVGVKMQIGEPFPDSPDEGILMTTCEFLPIASSSFEAGPPGEKEIELGRVIDRGIREGKVIDLKKLAIVEGEKVWMVFVDIYAINDDGNLFDAAGIGVMAALMNTKVPKLDENYEIIEGEYEGSLPLNHKVISLTAYKIGNKIIYDPSHKEDQIIDARLTAGIRDDGKIVSLQKGLEGSFTSQEVIEVLKDLKEKALEMHKTLLKF